MTTPPLLEVKNLRIGFQHPYGFEPAVRGIQFSVAPKSTYALVGESGCGKTMTSLAIMGLLPAGALLFENSEIHLQGKNLLTLPEIAMRNVRGSRIGMIFQEPMSALNPVLSVGEQLTEVLTTHRVTRNKKALGQEALHWLEAVGIPDPRRQMNAYPHELSGGMKQRVVIAMAIANKPELLIADEPTTALDVTIQGQILLLLKELQAKYGMSILLITHDLGVVAEMADEVGVMYQGQVVETNGCEALFSHPKNPYTQQLFNSVPSLEKRLVQAPKEKGAVVLSAEQLKTHFPIRKGLFKRQVGLVKAVDGVNLNLHEGQTLAIVGESGCGKTTLGNTLIRLLEPTEGVIQLEQTRLESLREGKLRPLREKIQMIFQDPFSSLDPRMTVRDIIAEGLLSLHPDFKRAKRGPSLKIAVDKQVRQLLDQVGLPKTVLYRYPHQFSGGQRQRIGIARALAMSPKVIICDEPTSALDVTVQSQILDLLLRLQKEMGLAYVFITHNISVVAYLAHEVAVMYLGRIVEQGPADEVLKHPKHPYTQGLLQSVPSMDPAHHRVTERLSGEQPNAASPPPGCHFHPRCKKVMPHCRRTYPESAKVGANHKASCHLYGEQ